MNPAADVWSKVITLMQPDMTATTINTWFDDASAVALEDDRFVLYSPTRFKRDIIATRYVGKIQAALRELFSCDMDVVVLTEGELDQYSQPEKDNFFPGTEEYTFERFVVGSSNKFAHAAARAVADLRVLTELCLPYVRPGGRFLAMKAAGCQPEVDAAGRAVSVLGGRLRPAYRYTIPGTEVERVVVPVEKTAPTPQGYPRRWAKIQKAPL